MKTLFPAQQQVADNFLRHINEGYCTLDTSEMGTGKTVVGSYIAKHAGRPIAVVCPKSVMTAWSRELEEFGVDPVFILNVEKLRRGNTEHLSKRGKKIFRWNLPEDTLILWDEIANAKGPYTQNAQILITCIVQGLTVHGMSGTPCEDPTEMRPLGYMLGLHNLNKSLAREGGLKSWFGWMLEHGCRQDDWHTWQIVDKTALDALNSTLYDGDKPLASRLTVDDFPDSFKENHVETEVIDFTAGPKIKKAYAELGITPEIIERYLEHGEVEDSEHTIVNILRARQLAEALKVPDLAEMAESLIEQGKSVVLFVNFRETVAALCDRLNCPRIEGGQTAEERQAIIDAFQNDEERVLAVNTAAGGMGISLHDIKGKYQRVSLVSPTFNAKDFMQVLRRIFRNGAKSDAIQKVLVSAGSVEEAVVKSLLSKVENIERLHAA